MYVGMFNAFQIVTKSTKTQTDANKAGKYLLTHLFHQSGLTDVSEIYFKCLPSPAFPRHLATSNCVTMEVIWGNFLTLASMKNMDVFKINGDDVIFNDFCRQLLSRFDFEARRNEATVGEGHERLL